MRFTILAVMVFTLCAALTFGSYLSESNYALYFFHGAVTLFMTSTLALPFICDKSRVPFWAAYATTTAYAMLTHGDDDDFFSRLVLLPMYYAGDAGYATDSSIAQFLMHVVQLWGPSMVGVVSGLCLAFCYKLSKAR